MDCLNYIELLERYFHIRKSTQIRGFLMINSCAMTCQNQTRVVYKCVDKLNSPSWRVEIIYPWTNIFQFWC